MVMQDTTLKDIKSYRFYGKAERIHMAATIGMAVFDHGGLKFVQFHGKHTIDLSDPKHSDLLLVFAMVMIGDHKDLGFVRYIAVQQATHGDRFYPLMCGARTTALASHYSRSWKWTSPRNGMPYIFRMTKRSRHKKAIRTLSCADAEYLNLVAGVWFNNPGYDIKNYCNISTLMVDCYTAIWNRRLLPSLPRSTTR